MPGIDGLLKLAHQQGANELRLAVDKSPRMFAHGAPKKLSVPAVSEVTLRALLQGILTPDIERRMQSEGSAERPYDAGPLGSYRVVFHARPTGFEVVFWEGGSGPSAAAAADNDTNAARPQSVAPAAPEPHSVPERIDLPKRGRTPTGHPPPPAGNDSDVDAATQATARMPAPRALREDAPVPALAQAVRARAAARTPGEPAPPPPPPPPLPLPSQPRAASEAPRLAEWLRHAAGLRASDLHLAEGECPCVRVDGALLQLDNEVVEDLVSLLPLEAAEVARLGRGESLDLALEIAGAGRVRAHIYTTFAGTAAALRLLPRAAPAFSSLNMPVAFDDLIDLPHGLVLVCGAAGSGKSTTLAALAQDALRKRSVVLITLEDPIEYALVASATSLVRRRQIGRDAPDFANGLRDALRADPDVLLLGELRDRATIGLALTAAETGHLVLASLHSRSAASAIERIVDGFPGDQQLQVRVQLAESLRAVVAQRLLPRKHGEGRLPAIELLRVNRAVASLIREGKSAQLASVLQSGRRDGMLALERSLADRVQAGEIDVDAAVATANDPEALTQFLRH